MGTVTGPLENVGDAVYVAAQRAARNTKAIKVTFAGGGILRIVYGVVGNARRNGAGHDAVESAGPGNAAELKLFEQNRGSLVEGGDVGAGKAIGQGNASEGAFLKRIAREGSETGAVLVVILNKLRIDTDGLAGYERLLLGLIEIVAAGENGKAGLDGAVKKIRLGKTKLEDALEVAELSGERQGFAEAQEVVGLVGQADKGTR